MFHGNNRIFPFLFLFFLFNGRQQRDHQLIPISTLHFKGTERAGLTDALRPYRESAEYMPTTRLHQAEFQALEATEPSPVLPRCAPALRCPLHGVIRGRSCHAFRSCLTSHRLANSAFSVSIKSGPSVPDGHHSDLSQHRDCLTGRSAPRLGLLWRTLFTAAEVML